jgi:hypothetical protein
MPSPNININSINTNSINININIDTNHHLKGSEQRCRLVDAESGSRTRLNMAIGGGAAELTSALATLDRQQNTRSSKRPTGGKPGWTKLILEPEPPADDDSGNDKEEYSLPQQEEFVYLLEPPSTPSMVILFLGGAGLGQYPNIAYSEMLSRISKRLNAAIIAAPYPLSLDHFDLSKKAGEALRRAVVQCEEKGNYSASLPKFYLGHSLGSKLLGIALAASGVRDVDGIGLMSYNNFGFKNTIAMGKDFADEFNKSQGKGGDTAGGGGMGGVDLDQILDFAGEAVSMMGFEFSPDPDAMDRIIQMKYDEQLQKKTRMFIFDDDDLDSSPSFLEACNEGSGSGPSVSRLPGKHLSPVYIKLGIDDLDLPEGARPFVSEAAGGFQNASFGDEDAMNGAVGEICNWIMGQEPSRPPLLSGQAESKI